MAYTEDLYDVVVIGGGPAGLTAALYLARACYRVVVLEAEKFGGQITITHEVVNYPGVERTSGEALTETMRRQAERFGAEFKVGKAQRLDLSGDVKTVYTDRGELKCFGICIATGAHPRRIGFAGEDEFRGRGVAYCATCDGEFFTGKEVFVVGGGFAAAEESVFLTKYATHVTILIRGDDFSCAESAANAARANEKITVLTNTEVEEVAGDTALRTLRYRNTKTGEVTEYRAAEGDTFGVFVFAGYEPATDLVKDIAETTPQGYLVTDANRATNVPGLYAAGDVCVKPLRQVVTAVGDGAIAATELEKYAAQMQEATGLVPKKPEPQKPAPDERGEDSEAAGAGSGLFGPEIVAQLTGVFGRMANPLILRLYLDDRDVSKELSAYMEEMAALTDRLSVEVADDPSQEPYLPCVRVLRADGSWSGLAFHGCPGGHEFTSFVLGLYNAAGPGQPLDEDSLARIRAIDHPVELQILVSLTCTMCPDLVTAAQRIAAENEFVTTDIYDLNHFQTLKDRYNVMSVPCMVINGEEVSFGKKNVQQLLDLIA